MERIEIKVPDKNDSFSRVVLDGRVYYLRFSWNDYGQYWTFGVYTASREPITQANKVLPRFPYHLQYVDKRLPTGAFGVYTNKERVMRNDFNDGSALFCYIPLQEV